MADGPNPMQVQMGLLGGTGGGYSPVGIPTPMPSVRTPGEMSAMLMQQSQMAAANTLQTTAMANGMMSPLGVFRQQYQANMGGIQSHYLNPYMAQSMGSLTGAPGFSGGMMPPPMMMTPPGMGIYRPFPSAPAGSIPPVPQLPLFHTPFTPQLPQPHFQSALDYQANLLTQRHQQVMGAALATPGIAGRAGADIGFGMLGSGVGALLGARFGGAGGARIGAAIGMGLGTVGSELGGFGATAQHMIDNMNPLRDQAIRTQQIRGMSPGFVVGGADLDFAGRGLSYRGASQVSRGLGSLSSDPSFQASTQHRFSTQDLTRITRMAGENGILDMAQSSGEIVEHVKTVAKALHTFMKVASQPDVSEAMKTFGQLRSMGMNFTEMNAFMREAQMYARMGGTTVSSIMENGGLQGAMTFQQAGLTAGLGMRMGVGAYGTARQMVAGGGFTTQQLALLGGTSGIAQREMESNAAVLKMPMMAAAMSNIGTGGTFGLNSGAMSSLARGKLNIGDMASMGANNLLDAVNKHGIGALGTFQMQQSQLQDSMGRALGPVGTSMMKLRQVMQTAQMMGLGKGPGALATAAQAMGMDEKQTMQLLSMANNPAGFAGMQQHLEIQRANMRAAAGAEDHSGSAFEATGIQAFGRNVGTMFGDLGTGIGDMFHTSGAGKLAASMGGSVLRTPDALTTTADGMRFISQLSEADMSGARHRIRQGQMGMAGTAALFRTPGGEAIGRNSVTGFLRDQIMGGNRRDRNNVRRAQGGAAAFFGGGYLEDYTRMLTLGHGFADAGEMESMRQDFAAGSNRTMRDLQMTAEERDKATTATAKRLGISEDALRRQRGAFASAVAEDANNTGFFRRHFGGAGNYSDKQYGEILERLKSEGKVSKSTTLDDLRGSLASAKMMANSNGQGKFSVLDLSSNEQAVNMRDAALNDMRSNEEQLFGERGFFDSKSRRDKALKVLTSHSSDKEVMSGVALLAAARRGDKRAGEKFASLSDEKQQKAMEIFKRHGKDLDDVLAKAGSKLSGMSKEDMGKFMGGVQKSALSDQAVLLESSGLALLAKDDSLAGGGAEDTLKSLLADQDKLHSATATAQDFAARYAAAASKGPEAQKRVVEEFHRAALATGAAGKERIMGGTRSANERSIDTARELLGSAAGEASSYFPQAVNTFSEASQTLLRAAQALGSIGPDTAFEPGMNE